jgi:hypothetical protein
MASPGGREPEDYQAAFARIEREVDAGNADLGTLGFWRMLGRVKREPALARHWAPDIGRIDRKAFERRVRFRVPVWLGNVLLLVATGVLVALVPIALDMARESLGGFLPLPLPPEPALPGVLVVLAGLGLSATVHDPTHWVVGRLVGIRFVSYYLDGPFVIEPAIKIDYETYMKADPGSRALMHASGALASKVAPFAVFAWVYFPHRAANYDLLPPWALWTVLGFGVLQIFTDIFFSTKTSDWKKVRRERRVARIQRAGI